MRDGFQACSINMQGFSWCRAYITGLDCQGRCSMVVSDCGGSIRRFRWSSTTIQKANRDIFTGSCQILLRTFGISFEEFIYNPYSEVHIFLLKHGGSMTTIRFKSTGLTYNSCVLVSSPSPSVILQHTVNRACHLCIHWLYQLWLNFATRLWT